MPSSRHPERTPTAATTGSSSWRYPGEACSPTRRLSPQATTALTRSHTTSASVGERANTFGGAVHTSAAPVERSRMAAERRMADSVRGIEGDWMTMIAVWAAVLISAAAALAQVLDSTFYDLGIRALDSNTHASIFGGSSLVANALAIAVAIALAARSRDVELVALTGALMVVLSLRVSYPTHVLVVSLPVTATALVILWRRGSLREVRSFGLDAPCSHSPSRYAVQSYSPVAFATHCVGISAGGSDEARCRARRVDPGRRRAVRCRTAPARCT